VKTFLPAGVLMSSCSLVTTELDARRLEGFERVEQVNHGPGEGVELPKANHINFFDDAPLSSIRGAEDGCAPSR
jgi:hypothetical protein